MRVTAREESDNQVRQHVLSDLVTQPRDSQA